MWLKIKYKAYKYLRKTKHLQEKRKELGIKGQ